MNKVVFGFGRFQPPTKGHQKLVENVVRTAIEEDADFRIYASHTQDHNKNPLSYEEKVYFMEEAFGPVVHVSEARTIIDVLNELRDDGYEAATIIVGEDRLEDFQRIIERYSEMNEGLQIEAISSGERDPDSSGIEGIAASLVREAVQNDDYETFISMLPDTLDEETKNELYSFLMEGMILVEAPLTMQQRRKRALTMKRIKNKMKLSRRRARMRRADKGMIERRARKRAIKKVKNKLAGGKNYNDLSYGEKIAVDKRFATRKRLLDMMTRKLIPQVRKDELRKKIAKPKPKNNAHSAASAVAALKKEGLFEARKNNIRDLQNKAGGKNWKVVPSIDKKRYPNREREGLEGPFVHHKSGKVYYYDKKEGKYYDPTSDMYSDIVSMTESI